jgi:DNA-binding transcriptional ArsR family regulator
MEALDVLGDPVRRRIVEILADGERTAGQIGGMIQAEFGISQPAVSQHLKVLRDNGFARVRIDGPRRQYALQAGALHEIDTWLQRFAHMWDNPLDALATELARGKRRRPTTTEPTDCESTA